MANGVAPDTIHCVGTMNYDSIRPAMREYLRVADGRAYYVPIEAGSRKRWIVPQIMSMRTNPALRIVKPGLLSKGYSFLPLNEYLTLPWFAVRRNHRFTIDLGYYEHAKIAWQIFKELQRLQGRQLRFQVGLADPLQVPLFTNLMSQYGVFERATINEARRIHDMVHQDGGEVTFQLDMPAQTVIVNLAGFSNRIQNRIVDRYAEKFAAYLEQFPEGARVAVHLCYGHKDDQSLTNPRSVNSTVKLANALSWAVPDNVVLEYVHLPLATPKRRPSTHPDYYRGLSDLWFRDANTMLAAGFAHKDIRADDPAGMSDQRRILELIRSLFNGGLMISGICGFGEDDPEVMTNVLQQQHDLLG